MRSVYSFVVLFALLSLSSAQFKIDCGFAYPNGSYISLEALAGYYYFDNVPASNNTPPAYLPQNLGNVTLEVQICGAVTQSKYADICTNSNSAVNLIDPVNNTCVSAGEANVAGWEYNPSTDGASLIYYHGLNITHTVDLSTRIYFECAPAATNLSYEFYSTPYGQYHLIFYHPAVCASNAVAPPPARNNTIDCATTLFGQPIDLSPVKAANGSFLFHINNTDLQFEVQICDNVVTNYPDACTTPSPANVYNTTSGVCTPAGDINAYAWNINPTSFQGVSLILYHGAPNGPVGTLQTRLYFECLAIYVPDPEAPPMSPNELVFEHYNPAAGNGGSYHLVMSTNSSCPAFILSSTSTTGATDGSSTTSSPSSTSTSASSSPSTTSPASFVAPSLMFAAFATILFFLF